MGLLFLLRHLETTQLRPAASEAARKRWSVREMDLPSRWKAVARHPGLPKTPARVCLRAMPPACLFRARTL